MPRAKVLPLLKRELFGVRANALLLLVIILFPVAFGLLFGSFKNVVPKDAPSAIFPEPGASESDMRVAEGFVSLFSKTDVERSFQEYKLYREDYYFFVGVPPGFSNGKLTEISVYIDASMSPVSELSPYVKDMILQGFARGWGWEPEIRIVKIGQEVLPFQYFVPGITIMLTAVVGLIIIPFYSSQDRHILSRILAFVPVPSFVSSKLLFAIVLSLLQFFLLLVTQLFAGTTSNPLLDVNWLTVGVLICSAVFFTSLGMAVMFLTGFGEAGKQVNAALLGFSVIFSGAFYPVGFFPSVPGFGDVLQGIGRSNPAYYFVLLMRGFGIRNLGPGIFLDYTLFILGCTIMSVILFGFLVWRVKRNG